MIILDTDHTSVLQYEDSDAATRLMARLNSDPQENFSTTVITPEEQMRGWLAAISGRKNVQEQIRYYEGLSKLLTFYTQWTVYPFDKKAADIFQELRRTKIRVKTMDLKIASIVLARGGKLLSANLQDFRQVPSLIVEDWLHT